MRSAATSTARGLGALAVLALLAGCGGSSSGAPPAAHEEGAPAGHDEHGDAARPDAGPGQLRVDATMLRDLHLTTAAVESRPAWESTPALGELVVVPSRYAEVGPLIAARVARIDAAPGDHVQAGQALAELESVELGRTRASAIAAEARLALARSELERTRGLAHERVASAQQLQQAEAEAATAEAEATAARAALSALGLDSGADPGAAPADGLDRVKLVAPLAGIVLDSAAVLGRGVEAGQTLFRVADTSRLWLVAHAYERDALRVRAGAPVRVLLPALPGETLSGVVVRVGSEVEQASRTIEVRVELDNADGRLLPGLSATAWLPLGEEDDHLLALPAAALQPLGTGWCVFLPGADEGLFEVRHVGRGRDLGGEVEVLSGLAAGEIVVVEGAFLLRAQADREQGGGGHHDH